MAFIGLHPLSSERVTGNSRSIRRQCSEVQIELLAVLWGQTRQTLKKEQPKRPAQVREVILGLSQGLSPDVTQKVSRHCLGFKTLGERYKQQLRTYAIGRESCQACDSSTVLFEDGRYVAEAYKAKDPVLVLIRPDGYIGWLGGASAIISAESYLKGILNTN